MASSVTRMDNKLHPNDPVTKGKPMIIADKPKRYPTPSNISTQTPPVPTVPTGQATPTPTTPNKEKPIPTNTVSDPDADTHARRRFSGGSHIMSRMRRCGLTCPKLHTPILRSR